MKKLILSIAIPLVTAFTLFMCSKQEKKSDAKPDTALDESAVAVTVKSVKSVSLALPVQASGLVSTKTEARLSFKIGGVVKSIYVNEGQSVQKGQLLATLDLTEIEAQVNQAKNNVEKLKRDLDRVKRLHADSAATLETLQNVQTGYNVALESLRIAEFNREYATIKAPTSGKILRKLLNAGELAAPGTPVFMMNATGPDEWIVKLGLADVDWVRVQQGDQATLTFDALSGEPIKGTISLIGEGADPFTGLYPVEVTIARTQQRLASGLFASAAITPSKPITYWQIPIEALVEGLGKNAFVFIQKSDKKHIERRLVKVAFVTDGMAYVTSGLEGVTDVITSGSGFLTDASTITIVGN